MKTFNIETYFLLVFCCFHLIVSISTSKAKPKFHAVFNCLIRSLDSDESIKNRYTYTVGCTTKIELK